MPIIRTEIKNKSRYPIDIVWENAMDLEHVAFLHTKTNKSFELSFTEKSPQSPFVYDVMVYRAKRRLPLIGINSFGMRKIISKYNIWQLEYVPFLGITSALNSLLFKNEDPEFPTLMLDEIVMNIPSFMMPFKEVILQRLNRHTKIQCEEDETLRARRVELQKRNINLPYTIFNSSSFENFSSHFKCKISEP